ncbi:MULTISPECIES: type I restriction-modification system subunit M [unclassified Polaromonas]|jgi:type I restriction enzyme M protein|uniref:type I restriction-modification system subunit M n=1 Tax=unclassified Polaromonas TaxID=2638319 RepID=UPI000BCCEC0E|nr:MULTISPECIES: type I restriction-modification system subunit M [unclassified Polaromonas]OYY37961.1 MAG: type I restriction-modification system subunit M [Polaromonas sp. 35-63-35]OYZ21142.1 MAG: type I restriction-modification system subunit M [Polaromonas sp. 16-63-31]OYZ79508.1 MAG: type I restriction-modification system subunit M [Polaromonas sp. 24-63-21]OZA50654.1 MAG: type I restriction-modification system subunit M [Polaromonas sp. 17-63-33]OZA89513.1 MAG: type I restriction-modific
MTEQDQKQLGKTLWNIADQLRGSMNADDFRDYMLSFLFLRYLSDNYEQAAKKELGTDYPSDIDNSVSTPLQLWYEANLEDVPAFEKQMRRKLHYVIKPQFLWGNIVQMAKFQDGELLDTLQKGFKYIEEDSFQSNFQGLFSEINLGSDKLGRKYDDRNAKLCSIISELARGMSLFSTDTDTLGDAYEYLIGQFAAGSGKKAGEFYTPQQISNILSAIVTLDSQEPKEGPRKKLESVFDFACGSGSLLLNIRHRIKKAGGNIGKIYGQEYNVTTYNLARMNMLLHGVKDTEFEIYHGDTLTNAWDFLRETNPAKRPQFDAVVANPPFSYRWEPTDAISEDMRFKNHGIAPKSAADFAFLLHGLHYLKDDGVMAIILPHGVLFRGGAEERIRRKLLQDGHIDTVIGLPANLFYSTGIPVCILVLKKCKKPDDVLFINAADHFEKGKRQNQLTQANIDKIVETYQFRKEEPRYARRVSMEEIALKHDFNLNIARYVSTSVAEEEINLKAVHDQLVGIEEDIAKAREKHNDFLRELGLPLLP